MAEEKRKEREIWVEQNFMVHHHRLMRKVQLLRMTKGDGKNSYKLNAPYATKRSHIIRLISERREKRESLVANFAQEMRTMRKDKEPVEYEKVRDRVFKK
jgi:large subunit ribosomal protein L23